MSILDTLQAKVDAIDSDSTMSEILQLMYNVKDHPYKSVYDSAGLMPTDSAYLGSIAYSDNRDTMYVFTNIDSGWKLLDSDVATAETGGYQIYSGNTSGYSVGGFNPSLSPTIVDNIEQFPFASDTNATDVGTLVSRTRAGGSGKSETHLYIVGGITDGTLTSDESIHKWPWASQGTSADVANLASNMRNQNNSPLVSETHAYQHGGYQTPSGVYTNVIQKFSISVDENATDVGDLLEANRYASGLTSPTHGYAVGGTTPPTTNRIQKYPFASDTNATDVGDLTAATFASATSQTAATGYAVSNTTGIESIPFASDTNATDTTYDLSVSVPTDATSAGSTGSTSGYVLGGRNPGLSPNYINNIQKYTFASLANTTDAADLTVGVGYNMGSME